MIRDRWYPILQSKAVGREPHGVRRLGQQLVLWRDVTATLRCMVDRCPHKGVRLSRGTVSGDRLRCPYHGFEFNRFGQCEVAPCMGRAKTPPNSLRVETFPVCEHDGVIWLWWGEAREALPPLPTFPEFEAMDFVSHDAAWEWPGHYTRYVESLLEVHHVPFVHPSLKLPVPEFLRQTRVFKSLEYVTGDDLTKASVVDRLEVWKDDDGHLRSEFYMRHDDELPFEETRSFRYGIWVAMPGVVGFDFPIEGFYGWVACTPIDERSTWVMWRYMMQAGRWPVPAAWAFTKITAFFEGKLAQPQDWVVLDGQTPDVPSAADRRFVGADRLNAVYLKERDRLLRQQAAGAVTQIDEPRIAR